MRVNRKRKSKKSGHIYISVVTLSPIDIKCSGDEWKRFCGDLRQNLPTIRAVIFQRCFEERGASQEGMPDVNRLPTGVMEMGLRQAMSADVGHGVGTSDPRSPIAVGENDPPVVNPDVHGHVSATNMTDWSFEEAFDREGDDTIDPYHYFDSSFL
jgi:hypothetical protein